MASDSIIKSIDLSEKKHFTLDGIPYLNGKVAVVQEGNFGIGYIARREICQKKRPR
ncbi:2423_t:CDS:2, partial [Cetraspora pellucida]